MSDIPNTAEDIFRVAARVEQNAADFYRVAAKMHPEQEKLLMQMSAMEEAHRDQMDRMREALGEEGRTPLGADPLGIGKDYLEAVADRHAGEGTVRKHELTGKETIKDILEMAVDAEKQAVLFYTGLRETVPEDAGRDQIEDIIQQEMGHVAGLYKVLKKVTA